MQKAKIICSFTLYTLRINILVTLTIVIIKNFCGRIKEIRKRAEDEFGRN